MICDLSVVWVLFILSSWVGSCLCVVFLFVWLVGCLFFGGKGGFMDGLIFCSDF